MMIALISPVNDLKVRKPDTMEFLKPEGEKLSVNTYWLRREREGSVSIKEIKESLDAEKKLKEIKI